MNVEKMWEVANAFSAIAGLFFSMILVWRFYIPYVKKRLAALVPGLVFFGTMVLLYFIPLAMSGVIAYLIGMIAVCITSVLAERRNIPQKILLAMTIYMFLWVSDVVALLSWKWIGRATFLNATTSPKSQFFLFVLALMLLIAIEKLILFGEIYISEKTFVMKSDRMEWRELTLLASPYIALMAGYWIISFMTDAYERTSGDYIWNHYPIYDGIRALYGMIAFLAVITVMHSYQQIRKAQRESIQNALVSRQIEELSGHVHTMEKLYSDIRGLRHDMGGHVMVLGSLLEQGKAVEAAAYLKEWHSGFQSLQINASTGNPVTDIILSEKKREAMDAGIGFVDHFQYPSGGKVESIDIGIILCNALSNAIRATSESTVPRIEVKSWKDHNAFLIRITNSVMGKLTFDPETGYPETSKEDRDSHGFGLQNMKRIAEKYCGTVQLEQEGDNVIFTAMLMIPR